MAMKILVAPGAFKESLTVMEATDCIVDGLMRSGLDAEYVRLPIADGGNGTLDAFLLHGGTRVRCNVLDPIGRPIEAEYGLIDSGKTAVIEMALASGLELLSTDERNPLKASTYGTGQLMNHALAAGVSRVIVGMGGSATVDGGIGCLAALGYRFYDQNNTLLEPTPASLSRIRRIDQDGVDPRWRDIEVKIASDVENPTLGKTGAAAVFGPQKGATLDDVKLLEDSLSSFFEIVASAWGQDVRQLIGGGAAGALSAGLSAFLGGQITSGVDLLLDYSGFERHLQGASLVITGEGHIDEQTLHGKGPIGVARKAHANNVPAVAIVGGIGTDPRRLVEAGLKAVISIVDRPMSLDIAIANAPALTVNAAFRLGSLLKMGRELG